MNTTAALPSPASTHYAQRFADERAIARRHHRDTVWLSMFVAVSVALFAAGAGLFSLKDLQQRLDRRARCAEHTYPWDFSPGYREPFASREACVESVPLLEGEAKDFGGFALAGLTVSALLTAFALRQRGQLPKALRIVRERPGDVVWAYIVQIVGDKEHTIVVRTNKGDSELLHLNDRLQSAEVLQRIAALCPNAVIGYTEELARRFAL